MQILLRVPDMLVIKRNAGISPVSLELSQQNLRNRVSFTQLIDSAANLIPSSATYYSYDIHGNVDTLVQDFGYGQSGGVLNAMNTSGNRFKKIVYNYDLISGKVNQVSYQLGQTDAYYHSYQYDAENRLTDVYTGRDSTILLLFPEKEAHYTYYKHGPLMRTQLGQLMVQGLDYAYTLQGWLKGINPTMGGTLTNGTDTTEASPVTQDVYGFSLHYYNNDYRAIGYTPQPTSVLGALTTNAAPLYNGNIAAMAVNIPQLSAAKVYNYHYDQLNRIVAMDMYNGLSPTAGTFTPVSDTSYKERVSYDPNGNILGYLRNGDAGNTMDSLNYKYYASTNKLSQVTDNVSATKYTTDIDNEAANNYNYDAIGNMISAASDTITNITWNVYGKIATITKNAKQIKYTYDAGGNRIMKQTATDTTVYVRDASGNVMSVYDKPAGGSLVQSEMHLYGSSRLGIATQHIARDSTIVLIGGFANGIMSIFTRGEKFFELSNHLGNVLATVSDRRIQVDANSDGIVDSYKADIVSANDYYPGGMDMPGRSYSIANTNYRYGFNGKEKDKEGSVQYDYGFRIYDPRLVRFKSVDPISKEYAGLTPYQFASNSPIWGIDRDGKEFQVNNWLWDIWMDWEFGDPTGIKTLKRGYEEKAAIETHQMSYHNDHVPADVQNTLDNTGRLDANINIAKGVSRLTTFNIKTSFDILSSVAPLGEALEVSLRGAEIVYGGIRAERVLVGSSERIAVIGRDFDARVLKFAAGFEKQTGKTVETFQASSDAIKEWQGLLIKYKGNVSDEVAKSSQIFKENSTWAQKVKKEGYKVLDIGLGTQDGKGTFYRMETKTIFGDK
jgi:RHS repeat-associated protein